MINSLHSLSLLTKIQHPKLNKEAIFNARFAPLGASLKDFHGIEIKIANAQGSTKYLCNSGENAPSIRF